MTFEWETNGVFHTHIFGPCNLGLKTFNPTFIKGLLCTLVWKIPWTEEPGGLQSMGSLRVGHD